MSKEIEMKYTRFYRYLVVAILFAAVLLLSQTFGHTANAKEPASGMGDLRILESQQSDQSITAFNVSPSYAGMGDVRVFDAGQSLSSNRTYVSSVDLHRLDESQSVSNTGAYVSSVAAIGMGDLKLFEAWQAQQK
jgi:hypothetical protein